MDNKEISKSTIDYMCSVSNKTERVVIETTKVTKKSNRSAKETLPPFIFRQPVDCSGIEDCGVKKVKGMSATYSWEKCPASQELKKKK